MLRVSLALPRHGVRATTFTRLAPFSTSTAKFRQQQHLSPVLNFSDEVKDALKNNKPIVALESTIISHGMPYPQNYETAIQVESVVRENGATPATIAILDGQIQIGLTNSQIRSLAELGRESVKASRRDLAVVMSKVGDFFLSFFVQQVRCKLKMTVVLNRLPFWRPFRSKPVPPLSRLPCCLRTALVSLCLPPAALVEFIEVTKRVCVSCFSLRPFVLNPDMTTNDPYHLCNYFSARC